MAQDLTSVLGSGQTPLLQEYPTHSVTPGTYPVPTKSDQHRIRTGHASVIINPEDFSVSIGVRQAAITVGTTATPLPADPLEYRRALVVHNFGTATVYLGDSSVTTANGMPLLAGEKIAFDIQGHPNVVIYAIAGSSNEVRIMELA